MPPKGPLPLEEQWAAEAPPPSWRAAQEDVEKRCAHIVWGSPEQVDSSVSVSDMAGDLDSRLRDVNFLNESISSRGNSISISGSYDTSSTSRQAAKAGHGGQGGGVRRRGEDEEEECGATEEAAALPKPAHELVEGSAAAGRADGHFGPCAEEEEEDDDEEGGPRRPSGERRTFMWSVGSKDHEQGGCRPCSYIHNKAGCVKGADCAFCHLEHELPSRTRPFKAKRLRCKKLAKSLGLLEANNYVRETQEVSTELSREDTYMLEVLKGRIRHLEAAEEDGPEK